MSLDSAASATVDFGELDPHTRPAIAAGLASRSSCPSAPAGYGERDYRPRLPTAQLIAEVRGLLAAGCRLERLLCRYLADLADRVQARREASLGPYADELEAARSLFGLGARETRERVRVGRALRHLPHIEAALVHGQLCYSRVREVTRVATAQTELEWLELGSRLDMRALERRVSNLRDQLPAPNVADGNHPIATGSRSTLATRNGRHGRWPEEPVCAQRLHPNTRRVTFELSPGAWKLLEQAMQAARRSAAAELSDGEALEAVAQAALSAREGARAWVSGGPEATEDCAEAIRGEDGALDAPEPRRQASPDALDDCEMDGLDLDQRGFASESGTVLDGLELDRGGFASDASRVEGSSPRGLELPTTQGGSMTGSGPAGDPPSFQCDSASRLLATIRGRQRWSLDALTEATGLLAKEVSVAMLLLELDGRVRWRDAAYEAV